MKDPPEFVDEAAFNQILEMDDDDPDRTFSKEIVFGFFDQVQDSLKKMHDSIESGDLQTLSAQGHYLKGSSATIGLTRIRDACEAIQSLELNANNKETMDLAKTKISVITEGCVEAEKYMRNFYKGS